jgi:hypothetical protein
MLMALLKATRGFRPQGPSPLPAELLAFMPNPDAFLPSTMDVYTGTGVVPPSGAKRISAASVYLVGVWAEGHRTKVTAKDGYTHLVLADPNLVIYDNYNLQGRMSNPDTLSLPAGQTSNSWFAVFSFISTIPGFGRRLIIAADRFGTPGSWTTLV